MRVGEGSLCAEEARWAQVCEKSKMGAERAMGRDLCSGVLPPRTAFVIHASRQHPAHHCAVDLQLLVAMAAIPTK